MVSRNLSLLIKPASFECNLDCRYCFYLDKAEMFASDGRHRMGLDALEETVRRYLQRKQSLYNFGWQGGEPSLMGVGFFEEAVRLQKKYNVHGGRIVNAFQTNATLLDDDFARFFADNDFLVGCSLDGTEAMHNTYRLTPEGSGSYDKALRGIGLLQEHGVDFNILTLVSRANVNRAGEVYRFLTDMGFCNQQYIPCVEFDSGGRLEDYSITGREWGEFLNELFDNWYDTGLNQVVIRNFDSILQKMLCADSGLCTMGDCCNRYVVVEYNGDVFPCDFFVEKERRLGSVMDLHFEGLEGMPSFKSFAERKSEYGGECLECRYRLLCEGDCPKHRVNGESGSLSTLCDGWREFYSHTLRRFMLIASRIQQAGADSA